MLAAEAAKNDRSDQNLPTQLNPVSITMNLHRCSNDQHAPLPHKYCRSIEAKVDKVLAPASITAHPLRKQADAAAPEAMDQTREVH